MQPPRGTHRGARTCGTHRGQHAPRLTPVAHPVATPEGTPASSTAGDALAAGGASAAGGTAAAAGGAAAAASVASSRSPFSAVSASRTSLVPAPRSGCCSRSLASSGLGPSSGSASHSPRTASSRGSGGQGSHMTRLGLGPPLGRVKFGEERPVEILWRVSQMEVVTPNGSGHRGMDTGSGLHGAAASSSPETDEIAPPLDALAGEATSSRSGGGSGWSRSGCSARLLG